MSRWTVIGVAGISALSSFGIGARVLTSGQAGATAARARSLAVEFFRSQNERQYDRTCGLLSRRFYVSHRLRDQQTCVALLRISFMWSGQIAFKIGAVDRVKNGFVVRAIADGAQGQIVLVKENGDLKILAVRSE
jgi:hypothetical protein